MSTRNETAEVSGAKPCPHCGARLDRGLAQHMTLDCEATSSPLDEAPPPERTLPDRYDTLPLLEEADKPEPPDDDLDERRALADELAEKGVWTVVDE